MRAARHPTNGHGEGPLRVTDVVRTYGPVTVAGFITLEGMGLPLPGELVLLTAGALAAQGDFSIVTVMLAAWIGTIAGGSGGYWIGRTGGVALIRKYGRWIGFSESREAATRSFFQGNGARTIIIARFVAVLRMLASVLAGSAGMSFGLFSVCNAFGGLIWSAAFGAIGYYFGSQLPLIEQYLHRGSLAILAALAIIAAIFWWYRRNRRNAV